MWGGRKRITENTEKRRGRRGVCAGWEGVNDGDSDPKSGQNDAALVGEDALKGVECDLVTPGSTVKLSNLGHPAHRWT